MKQILPSSFRDPSGHLFLENGLLFRQVNLSYKHNYELLISSGLYDKLTAEGLLIPHKEVSRPHDPDQRCYKVIQPEPVPFISYPYEWCFSQLKDAALLTLRIQKLAFDMGMSLKDASAYNIQFHHGAPLLIDTLSFEKYEEGEPWVAYRQFCQHFLAPLALMSYTDARLSLLLRDFIDGIPLDLASSLLPGSTWLRPSLLAHLHVHAKAQRRFGGAQIQRGQKKMRPLSLVGLIAHLESAVKKLNWKPRGTEWADYYQETNYTTDAFECKKSVVASYLDRLSPRTVWDLGANQGVFSRLAGERGIHTVAYDIDMASVEKNYLVCKLDQGSNVIPLLLDLTNPSPGLGWETSERTSFLDRGKPEVVLALALIHHLAISNNVPLDRIATFLARICSKGLIVEFVPKSDSQVQRLLRSRPDTFPDYTVASFEKSLAQVFAIDTATKLKGSERTLYLMKHR